MNKIMCKLGFHNYLIKGKITKANDGNGGYIFKACLVCSRCGRRKLKVIGREPAQGRG